jgi:(p)ppGpp synthase/HD superfamily hydrolase
MRGTDQGSVAAVLKATTFAASKHRDQRRKDREASPYINHPITVAALLAEVGVTDLVALQAALLHDVIEDTGTRAQEIDEMFGSRVCEVVLEMTDDKRLPKGERKRLQIEHAADLSDLAKLVKLGDKIANVRDLMSSPPVGWDEQRRREYLRWTEQVVAGCRGVNQELEDLYDAALREALTQLDALA